MRVSLAPDDYLLLATDGAIRSFKAESTGDKLIEVASPIWIQTATTSLDYDDRTGSVFYSHASLGIIVEVNANGSSRTVARWLGNGVNGIAVDWSSDLIYYTDKENHSINVVSRDGLQRAGILDLEDQSVPSDIVLDPLMKYDLLQCNSVLVASIINWR